MRNVFWDKCTLIFLGILFICYGFEQKDAESVLSSLDRVIVERDHFVNEKLENINELKRSFSASNSNNLVVAYNYYFDLCEQYQTFRHDSAFCYAKKLNEIARKVNDAELIARAKIEFSNILISAGIFTESLDTLRSINLADLSSKAKAEYFQVLSRGYFDMESFSQCSEYSQLYRNKGLAAYDSAMIYIPKSSWKYHSLNAQKNIKLGQNDAAIFELENIINTYNLTNDELAIQKMMLAFVYGIEGDTQKEIICLAEAAMADFKGAKKEGVALLYLANILYHSGDILRASRYINIALEDSRYYGSNFRLWQVSNFLPVIKAEHIETIEKQKKQLWSYALTVTLLALLVGTSFVIIVKQIVSLKKSKKTVEKTINKLAISNEKLLLANKIKEKYIGYYFEINSQIIEKLDGFKKLTIRSLRKKQFEELRLAVENFNILKEKTNLYHNFDKAFLEIFPEFIISINMLLEEDKQIQIKEGQLLNTELRIFALIRLGINDAYKLARILDYSVNTIYAYKSKIKHKAKNPERFEQDVMLIAQTTDIETRNLN